MPSIRVKGRVYSNLDDRLSNDGDLRLDSEIPSTSVPPVIPSNTPSLQPRLSLPLLRPDPVSHAPLDDVPRRPRATTTSSRIHDHCTNTLRNARTSQLPANLVHDRNAVTPLPSPNISPSHTYPHSGEMIMMEGPQTDVMISSHGEPGIIESSINLPHTDVGKGTQYLGNYDHHHDDVVEHLDAIDPQVGAVSSLTNAANAIIIPPSNWYSRKPVVVLPSARRRIRDNEEPEELEDSLDRHVDDVLKRPSKARRTLMGVWSFLKTPMGIITGIYGFLVVFWGAAIVIFLVKIINFHNANTQGFWVEVSSQVETGLFTVTSIGLIPSRVLDTYRIWKIWRYKQLTIKLRAKAGLPQLFDVDDLPDPIYDPNYVHVLTEAEQEDLHRQQRKFQYSQTWYRAHGTETHRAFPINTALWICFMNDGNSIFQIFLCGTMWSLNRFQRPAWSTGILIPASFLCGIAAAVLIWRGGERTKRVEEVKERLRAALADKQLPKEKDGNLPQSPVRNSGTPVDLQPAMLDDSKEKGQECTSDAAIVIDEQMTIPSAGRINDVS
ncbi:hypothetical protein B0H34DRAFT_688456 [Crassisporium funariophilum]|nr:hypothetical protein B0H34DRAFT_688456 [Crassisporium funariophilum]